MKDFDPAAHFEPQRIGLLDRVSQFAVVAARQALAQSGLSLSSELAERTAAIRAPVTDRSETIAVSGSIVSADAATGSWSLPFAAKPDTMICASASLPMKSSVRIQSPQKISWNKRPRMFPTVSACYGTRIAWRC